MMGEAVSSEKNNKTYHAEQFQGTFHNNRKKFNAGLSSENILSNLNLISLFVRGVVLECIFVNSFRFLQQTANM